MSLQNETTTVTTVYRNLTFNMGVPNSTFEYKPPADATVETTTLPSVQTYDSRSAAAQNVSFALPEPNVPGIRPRTGRRHSLRGERERVTLIRERNHVSVSDEAEPPDEDHSRW